MRASAFLGPVPFLEALEDATKLTAFGHQVFGRVTDRVALLEGPIRPVDGVAALGVVRHVGGLWRVTKRSSRRRSWRRHTSGRHTG